MKTKYQVAIIGAGPSAIFAALTLTMNGVKDAAIFEKGKDVHERKRGRGMDLLYTNRIKLSPALETEIRNLFFVGDGSGITRGLMQASISGTIAAKEILKRIGKDPIRL